MLDVVDVNAQTIGPTRLLSELVGRGADLRSDVVEAARRAFLDWLGCAITGSRTAHGRQTAELAGEEAKAGSSTLFFDRSSISPAWAAFANAAGSYAIEFDDVHMASILHGGVTVIPAAFAVAEDIGASGASLLEAIVIGYDVAFRIGSAVGAGHYRRHHSTGTVGTFGAAAAVARLMRLDTRQTEWAFGHAGSMAAALWPYLETGADTRTLHPAKAAMNGVIAARLAGRDYVGPTAILEGGRGFFATMADAVDMTAFDGVGTDFKILENGFKRYPCCRHAHVGLDLILALREQNGFRPGDIERLSIAFNPVSHKVLADSNPQSALKAAFSMAYLAAHALVTGTVDLTSFAEDRMHDTGTRALMRRIDLVSDPALAASFPAKWTTKVEVTLKDGRSFAASADLPTGDYENPISTAQLERKFLDLVAGTLDETAALHLLGRVREIERMPDMRLFFGTRGT
jgi:2-methylcitrate dehydratase PrpD